MVLLQVAQLGPHALHLLLQFCLCQTGIVDHLVERADLLLHRLPERLLILISAGGKWAVLSATESHSVCACVCV